MTLFPQTNKFSNPLKSLRLRLAIKLGGLDEFTACGHSMSPTILNEERGIISPKAYNINQSLLPVWYDKNSERYKNPERGDIVKCGYYLNETIASIGLASFFGYSFFAGFTFFLKAYLSPFQHTMPSFKRVIGLPYDTIEIKKGEIFINSKLINRKKVMSEITNSINTETLTKYEETLENGATYCIQMSDKAAALENMPPFSICKDHFFIIGDNRSFSLDSRNLKLVGCIPRKHIQGRAEVLVKENEWVSLKPPIKTENPSNVLSHPVTQSLLNPTLSSISKLS